MQQTTMKYFVVLGQKRHLHFQPMNYWRPICYGTLSVCKKAACQPFWPAVFCCCNAL